MDEGVHPVLCEDWLSPGGDRPCVTYSGDEDGPVLLDLHGGPGGAPPPVSESETFQHAVVELLLG